MKRVIRILLVGKQCDVFPPFGNLLEIQDIDFYIESAVNRDGFEASIEKGFFDVILFCYHSVCLDILTIQEILKRKCIKIPIVLINEYINDDIIAYAIKSGVDNIVTGLDSNRLVSVIMQEIECFLKQIREQSIIVLKQNAEQKFQHIVECIDDIFFALDMNLNCIYWNKAVEKLTGIPVKSALLRSIHELFPNEIGFELEKALKKATQDKQSVSTVMTYLNGNHKYHYHMCIYPSKYGFSVLLRETPEDKIIYQLQKTQEQINNQLAHSQELRFLGQLTSGVAHEVRNPLNAISVVIEALFQDLGENPEFLPYKEHIFTHVDRLKRLMQDLLELGKPMERSKVLSFYSMKLLHESVALWKSSGPHGNQNISIINKNEDDIIIQGNPLKLQQVFMNILENASQHSPQDSLITITRYHDSNNCIFEIRDSGTGIKAEHLEHMFEPFFTTRKRGTGLGLAIVKHIVEVHGGGISIGNNVDGSGCMVLIQLPVFRLHKNSKNEKKKSVCLT